MDNIILATSLIMPVVYGFSILFALAFGRDPEPFRSPARK